MVAFLYFWSEKGKKSTFWVEMTMLLKSAKRAMVNYFRIWEI